MKKRIWKIVSAALCMIMVMSQTVFADSIMGGEKEYVSLGADLSQKEKETVLKLLDIDNLEDYDVEYITNKQEHEYLDEYLSKSVIGSRALSSVRVK